MDKDRVISPSVLTKLGIGYDRVIQEEGDILLALDEVMHFGYNLGPNIAEAWNFATLSWAKKFVDMWVCNCETHKQSFLASQIVEALANLEIGDCPLNLLYYPQDNPCPTSCLLESEEEEEECDSEIQVILNRSEADLKVNIS
jgi:hypothetical protein